MLRRKNEEDRAFLENSLLREGFNREEMGFDKHETWVLVGEAGPEGFFTFRIEGQHPYLVHFCLAQEHRGAEKARSLAKAFVETMKAYGFSVVIASIRKKDTNLKKMLSYYFRRGNFYAEHDEHEFFITEV